MTLLAVAAAVFLALALGALWGLYGRFGDRTEGFVPAAGGRALMFSAVLELIVPVKKLSLRPRSGLNDTNEVPGETILQIGQRMKRLPQTLNR